MYPRRRICIPPTRSHDRAFILWGIADEPTCPSLKPSVTVSLPAMSRTVIDSEDIAAPSCTSADSASKSSDRGYTWPTDVNTRLNPRLSAMRCSSSASFDSSPPMRSSMSWLVPIGPLMPRSG